MKNKKGFTLVECVVALSLISIIVGAVLTVFSVSRNQIKAQNTKFESDLLQSNIIAAYEASGNYNNMANILDWQTKDEADEASSVPIAGSGGNSSIPVSVHFDKITVDGGNAIFKSQDRGQNRESLSTFSDVISFAGEYENNRLSASQIPSGYYTETPVTIPKQMVLEGSASGYSYTLTVSESDVNLKMGSGDETRSATDFDKYLLNNGYYLKCVKSDDHDYDMNLMKWTLTVHRYFFFQLYSAVDNNPVSDGGDGGGYIFFLITQNDVYAGKDGVEKIWKDIKSFLNTPIDSFSTTVLAYDTNYFGNTLNTYLDLSQCTVKTYTGNSCPDAKDTYSKNEATSEHQEGTLKFTELTVNGYNFKTGNWYFTPWLGYRFGTQYTPQCTYFDSGRTYYEYIPNEGKASDIYYIFKSGGKVKLFDTDSENIFSFEDTASAANNALSTATSHCNITNATTVTYQNQSYDVWYKKGKMPGKTISHIQFDDDKKEITIYDDENQPFIRFLYKNSGTVYSADKNSILNGAYAGFYTVSGNTATVNTADTVNFSCSGFTGPYTIKVSEETVFVSNAELFEIKGSVPMNSSQVSYGIIGEPESVSINAQTYYTSCVVGNTDTTLVIKVTFCDLAKPKTVSGKTVEPEIKIWSVKTTDMPQDLKNIETCTVAHPERFYRKG